MKYISLALFIKNLTEESFFLWMQTREEDGPLKGYWEFPGGNIESGETPIDAVIREVKEEVDLEIAEKDIKRFNNFTFEVHDKKIEFFTFIVKNSEPNKGKWFEININSFKESLPEKIPPANYGLIRELCEAIKMINPKEFDLIWTK